MVSVFKRAATSTFILFLTCFNLSTYSVQAAAKLKIMAPASVVQGDTFQASVENASSKPSWTYDTLRLKATGAVDSLENTQTFQAVSTGDAWIEVFAGTDSGRNVVVITGEHADKLGRSRADTRSRQEKAVALLENGVSSGMDEISFFRKMGELGLSVRDMVEAKAEITNREARRLTTEEGVSGTLAVERSVQFWNDRYQPYEQSLMQARLDAVQAAWKDSLKKYVQLNPDVPYIGAKMDIGGWAKEKMADMRFEGDIDFSMIMVDVENGKQLRDLFESECKRVFNLDMIAIDALGTAHRAATTSVYIGDYGAKWAEIDAIRRGKIFKIEVIDGKIVETLVETMADKIYLFAVLENNEYKKKTGEDILQKIIDEGDPQPKADMEPGVSLEFLRHVTVDSIGTKLTIIEKIIKISKYVNRSAADHAGFLEKVPGFTLVPQDTALVEGVAKVIEIKERSVETNAEKAQKIRDILAAAQSIMGPDWAEDPQRSFEDFGKRATDLIKYNIGEGIRARILLIENIKDEKEKIQAGEKLLADLETEYKAFSHEGVPFPDTAMRAIQKFIIRNIDVQLKMIKGIRNPEDQAKAQDELLKYLETKYEIFKDDPSKFPEYAMKTIEDLRSKKGRVKLTFEQMSKMAEMVKKSINSPDSAKFMTGIIWEGMVKTHKTTNDALNGFNNFIDFMDNASVEKLRNYNILEGEMSPDGKFMMKAPVNIQRINDELNGTILGKVGNSLTFKGINMFMEGYAYYQVYSKSDNWEEGLKNISLEFFKRRAPGVQIAEAYYQEDYFRVGREMVYTLFPPLAIPEGIYGLASSAADWGVGIWEKERYEEMVDKLYESSHFKEMANGKGWKFTGIDYACPGKGNVSLSREHLADITDQCPNIQPAVYIQIRNHPVLVQFEKILGNKMVSSGQSSFIRYPYYYDGLSRYGAEVQKIYHKKVNMLAKEYFVGLITELEKRKALNHDLRAKDLYELQKKWECREPLLDLSGNNTKEERDQVEELFKMDQLISKANDTIDQLKKVWKADFLEKFEPTCRMASFKKTGKAAEKFSADVNKAIQTAAKDVQSIIGVENTTPKILKAPTQARLRMVIYDNSSKEYDLWYNKYHQALDALRGENVPLTVAINGPVVVCPGQHVKFTTKFNKNECVKCSAEWNLINDAGAKTRLKEGNVNGLSWIPQEPGTFRLFVKISQKGEFQKVRGDASITVLKETECSDLSVRIKSVGSELPLGDTMILQAVPVSLGADNMPFTRYFWSIDGTQTSATAEDTYALDSNGYKEGDEIIIELTVRTKNNQQTTASLIVTVVPSNGDGLTVTMEPQPDAMTDYDRITFSASSTKKWATKSNLIYQWSVDGEPAGENQNYTFSGKGRFGKVKLSVYVQEVSGEILVAEGQATSVIDITATGEIPVVLDDYETTIPDDETFTLCVKSPDPLSGSFSYYYAQQQGNHWSVNQVFERRNCLQFSPRGLSDQSVVFKIQVKDEKERTGEVTTASIKIISAPPEADESEDEALAAEEDAAQVKAEQKRIEQEKLKKEQLQKETTQQASPENGVETGEGSSNNETKAVSFAGTVPNIWEGEAAGAGFSFNRKEAYVKIGADCSGATAGGSVSGKFDGFGPRTKQEVLKQLQERSDADSKITPFSIDGFGGYLLETKGIEHHKGYYSGSGFVDERALASGDGWVVNGQQAIHIRYSVGGHGCSDNRYRSFIMSQTAAALSEARSILSGVHLVEGDGGFAKTPYNGPKLDGSDMLRVSLTALPDRPSFLGEQVEIAAIAIGGKPPYSYKWTGNHGGEGTKVLFGSQKTGEHKLSVEVTDAEDNSTSAEITIQVEAVDVKISQTSPESSQVVIGTPVHFKAEIDGGGKSPLEILWQPHPEVAFKPFEKSSVTTAVFTTTGIHKVWAQVFLVEGKTKKTVGESEQLEVAVIQPRITLTADKPKPYVGEIVTFAAKEKPAIKDDVIDFWWELKGNAMNKGALSDPKKYSFIPKDTKPITVTVHAKAKDGGVDLAEKTITITSQKYEVSVSKPKRLDPPPWKWDPKQGKAVELPMAIAVFQNAEVHCSITPKPSGQLRYKWTVSPDGCTASSPGSSGTTLNAHEKGTYQITAEVLDKNNIKLGQGSETMSVTVSQKDLNVVGKKAENQKEAQKLQDEGRKKWEEGKLQQAIAKVTQAQKLAGEDKKIGKTLATMKKQKRELDTKLDQVADLLGKGKVESGEKVLESIVDISPNYPFEKEITKRLDAAEKAKTPDVEKPLTWENLGEKEEQQQKILPDQLINQAASKKNASNTLSVPLNQPSSEKKQASAASAGSTSSPNGKVKTEKPPQKNPAENDSGGYWQLVEEKGSIGRECAPEEVYNDYYRDTVSGFGSHIKVTKMVRKNSEVYCKLEVEWQRPPEKLYPEQTINLPVTIHRLADSGKYSCGMSVSFDTDDMECGTGSAGSDIGSMELDRKGPESLNKPISWKVKKPFHQKAGEKLTIRACYSAGANICGENQGMKYYYTWVPNASSGPIGQNQPETTGQTKTSTSYAPNSKGDVSQTGAEAEPAIIKNDQGGIKNKGRYTGDSDPRGEWETSQKKMILHGNAQNINGTYEVDQGKIMGRMVGNVLDGYWTEHDSDKKCSKPINGNFHWGRIKLRFEGDSFTGFWGYCQDEPEHKWTGRRKQ